MLLAGGQGSRLAPLTNYIAKPAVPFGAKYRIIDFSLSNCVNSGIDTVGVLTQFQPLELNDYLGNGAPWDMNLRYGGLHVLPPYQAVSGADWFKGTANAIYQNIRFIKRYDPEYVVILSGDHIYKMNYRLMLEEHIANDAACTIAVMDVPIEEASRFGIMATDGTGRITEFQEKPAEPKSTQASMGVYIFSTDALIKYLEEDEKNPESENDFGKNVIPAMLNAGERMFAYIYKGYWRDVGTLTSYWEANMDAIGINGAGVNFKLNDPLWRIYYRHTDVMPQYIGGKSEIHDSIIADSCNLNGLISRSVISPGADVEEGAVIIDSVILPNVTIKKGARIEYSIIDSDTTIGSGAVVGGNRSSNPLTVIGRNVIIGDNETIAPGSVITEDMKGEAKA